MSDQSPTVFNERYEMHRHLARGGMSDVYLAKDLLLDRPVAVKVLFPEYARDPTFVERFRREAQAAANLNHPNIVAVYDWGQQSGTYFIVMEYVEGRSLSDIVHREGPLHPRRAAEIAADVAAALGFAHRNGVVHRDIKPGNILIAPSGQVKVADFGIAQAVVGGSEANLTQAGAVMGTATYFSPEQAQGKAVDPRSDLYSLGCVLYEMLTTRPPFSGDTPVAIAYKHVQEPAPLPSSTGVAVPPALEAIVAQLMAKDPANRYASAEDLRADLRNYLEGLPVSALHSQAALMAGLGAGGVGATAAVAATAAPSQPVPPVTVPPAASGYPSGPPPKRRSSRFLWVLLGVLVVLAVALVFLATRLDRSSAQQKAVPNVVGEQVATATQKLENDGFKVKPVQQANTDHPNGQVFGQDPVGGQLADVGSTVTIQVSKGAGQKQVPNVIGLSQEAATQQLEAATFTVRAFPQSSDTVPVGQVISQSPAPNTMADQRSEVDIQVSSGPATVKVPDVSGQSAASAAANLAAQGFVVSTVEQSSTTVPNGIVIGTNPSAGIQVAPKSPITIIVSSGPPATSSTSSSTTSSSTTSTTAKK
ncbi:MAG TPA: Stk1 family PASTA domain-containing Ser/Thr kinase [Acidimicrobiales bacterium]|nr:Stk1 family PASTA domain-containing Ser/Thr kinase [Acidimicrobiales bacterium]